MWETRPDKMACEGAVLQVPVFLLITWASPVIICHSHIMSLLSLSQSQQGLPCPERLADVQAQYVPDSLLRLSRVR